MASTFTLEERDRIRYHLGYLSVQPAASLQYGLPRPAQTLFMVEQAMDDILPEAEPRVRTLLETLDGIECKMIEGQDYLVANRMADMEIRKEHIDALEREYYRWANRLADIFGVPLYHYSDKFRKGRSSGVSNVKIVG